jgi:hypothetical protein
MRAINYCFYVHRMHLALPAGSFFRHVDQFGRSVVFCNLKLVVFKSFVGQGKWREEDEGIWGDF